MQSIQNSLESLSLESSPVSKSLLSSHPQAGSKYGQQQQQQQLPILRNQEEKENRLNEEQLKPLSPALRKWSQQLPRLEVEPSLSMEHRLDCHVADYQPSIALQKTPLADKSLPAGGSVSPSSNASTASPMHNQSPSLTCRIKSSLPVPGSTTTTTPTTTSASTINATSPVPAPRMTGLVSPSSPSQAFRKSLVGLKGHPPLRKATIGKWMGKMGEDVDPVAISKNHSKQVDFMEIALMKKSELDLEEEVTVTEAMDLVPPSPKCVNKSTTEMDVSSPTTAGGTPSKPQWNVSFAAKKEQLVGKGLPWSRDLRMRYSIENGFWGIVDGLGNLRRPWNRHRLVRTQLRMLTLALPLSLRRRHVLHTFPRSM